MRQGLKLAVGAGLLIGGGGACLAQGLSPQQQFARSAVVRVRVSGLSSTQGQKTIVGSGFFVSRDGYLLTAAHVLGTRDEWSTDPGGLREWNISVSNRDVSFDRATVVYQDTQTDLALLKVSETGRDLPFIPLGDSRSIQDGDDVVAFGFSDGALNTHRGFVTRASDPLYLGVLKLSVAAANREDSGGPVIDAKGRAIGVIRAGLAFREQNVYATPINLAAPLIQMIRSPNYALSMMPVGTIVPYFGAPDRVPNGFLICDGSAVDRAVYPDLYDLLVMVRPALRQDDRFARLPDLRGEFLRGADAGRGLDSGREVGSEQESAVEAHSHALSQSIGVSGGWNGGWGDVEGHRAVNSPGDAAMVVQPSGGPETRPRNLAVIFLIRAEGSH